MSSIIKVTGLSKSYTISHEGRERYTSLRDVVAKKAKKIFSFPGWKDGNLITKEVFWALKDVNFDIAQGDRVGIIGRNGAGKSTLLKILSRITEPSAGSIMIKGRVASLLEVGTGFHPELTGRENIFLNGAILGMSQAEIKKQFDAIVDFAEVEKFLDTPVKRYSSGMYVRLAFAVAAFLEPEILIIDEVLAVGDAQFQKKCLGKMEDVSKNDGRTVLFVSHNMTTISTLCNRGILLENGKLVQDAAVAEVLKTYQHSNYKLSAEKKWETGIGDDVVRIYGIRVINTAGRAKDHIPIDEMIGLEIDYEVLAPMYVLWQGFNVFTEGGVNIFDTHNVTSKYYREPHPVGRYRSVAWIPENLLAEGTYIISAAIFNHLKHVIHVQVKEVVSFTVIEKNGSLTARGESVEVFPGLIRPLLKWETEKI